MCNLIEQARNREGVALHIVTADGELLHFERFMFTDDPFQEAETIFQNMHIVFIKFFVEQGFLMSSDNKNFLGQVVNN